MYPAWHIDGRNSLTYRMLNGHFKWVTGWTALQFAGNAVVVLSVLQLRVAVGMHRA